MRTSTLMTVFCLMGCVPEGATQDTAVDPSGVAEVPPICSVVPDGGPATCPTDSSPIDYAMIGPNVQLVVDRSGSMKGGKWAELEALTPMLPLVGARANLGLTFFPALGATQCETEGGTVVPLSEGNRAAEEVADFLLGTTPAGATPMADTLDALVGEPALQCPNRDNIVVLLSDGKETCDGHPVSAARRLIEQPEPVELYVIGFGTNAATNYELQRIANAAGPTSGPDNFYTASTADELVARLAAVTATCTAQLDASVDPHAVTVTLDGRVLSECTDAHCAGGYSVDATWGNIRIEGEDCLSMLDGECHDLRFDHAQ